MAAQLRNSRFPVATALPHRVHIQTSKLRVGTNNQYVVSNGRNIVLHDLLTGEVKKLVTVDRDVDHSIGDMVWLGADHIAYYTEWHPDRAQMARACTTALLPTPEPTVKVVCVSTQKYKQVIRMPHHSLTPHKSLTAIDDEHILFQSCHKMPPVFAIVCNAFTGEQVKTIRMLQPEPSHFMLQPEPWHFNFWSTPVVAVQKESILALRTNPKHGLVAFDIHNLSFDKSTPDAVQTLPITDYKHKDIHTLAALPSTSRVVLGTTVETTIICIKTAKKLLSVPNHDMVPTRTLPLSENCFVQSLWDCRARRGRISVMSFTAHTCHRHYVRDADCGCDPNSLQYVSKHHFLALIARTEDLGDEMRHVAVFTACNLRTHMAALQLSRHWRQCSSNPCFHLCRRLLATRTEESVARENAERRKQLALTRKRMRAWDNFTNVHLE